MIARSADAEEVLPADIVLLATGAHPRELDSAPPDGERIFTWNDSDSGARVEVRAQMYGGKSRVYMQVTRDGLQKRMVLASGAQIRDASLVLYNDFVLVLAGPYVIGGYQVSADKILPMNAPALPFTVRSGSGFVLDEVHLADGDNVPPPNFIERPDRR